MMIRFCVFLLLPVATAVAWGKSNEAALDVETPFHVQQQKIKADFEEGKKYSEISAKDREQVELALGRIAQTMATVSAIDELTAEQKVQVFNDQELVNTTLTKASQDSRLICRRETPVGTRRSQHQCSTVGERRRQSEDAREMMNRTMPRYIKSE